MERRHDNRQGGGRGGPSKGHDGGSSRSDYQESGDQQKRKEGESAPNPAAVAGGQTPTPGPPPAANPATNPTTTEKTEEKKDWKRKDLKKAKAAQQALTEQQTQPPATGQRGGPQPSASQQPQASSGQQQRGGHQQSAQPQSQGSWSQPQRGGPQQSQGGQQQRGGQQGSWGQEQRGGPQQSQGGPQQRGGQQGSWGQEQRGGPQQQRGGPPQQQYQQRTGPPPQQQYSQQRTGTPQGQQYQGRGGQPQYQQGGRGGGGGYQDRGGDNRSSGFQRGGGGNVPEGSKFQVEANYVDLIIPTNLDRAYHYDVKIDPERPKKMYRKAVDMYCKTQFKDILVAFDGKASAYSAVELPGAMLVEKEVTVTPEIGRPKVFKVTLSKTKDMIIDMSVLRTYGSSPGGLANKPMRALQCLEVVLAHQCHEKGVRAGRSFFYRPDRPEDLLDGYELWYGLFQAAILGQRTLLNIDVSHKAFPKPNDVLSVYDQLVNGFKGNVNNFAKYMEGSDVIYEQPKSFNAGPKQYRVNRVMLNLTAKSYRFDHTDEATQVIKNVSVFDYFKGKGYSLKYPDYPLLHVGPRDKNTYLPIEFCRIAENQVSNKQTAQRQVTEIIKHSAISSWDRKKKILALFHYFHAKSSPIVERFGVSLGKEFIKVFATRLFAPKLEYNGRKLVSPVNGAWRNDKFYKPAPTQFPLKWCVINLESYCQESAIRNMGSLLIKTCQNNGVNIESKPNFEVKRVDSRALKETLRSCVSKYDFVIVVLSRRGNSYAEVKQAAELDGGMLTQCIKADTVEKRSNESTLGNILLKLNSKLNGINQRIDKDSQTVIFDQKNHVMLLGADVTHPSPQQRAIPSIVGTCATYDPDCVKYNMQYRIQDPKKEIIVSMKDIVLEHLKFYFSVQKRYPTHILYYRDGVADGQFEQVLDFELNKGMNLAFGEISKATKQDYRPKVTCIIVQKRNHTRFFPVDKASAMGRYDNVFPGTCCSDVICHPKEKEFFLVSHESIKGTARPTKYIVIRDESNFNLQDIQNLTYSLCHLFPRCNRSVSYPAPAYLAHLVAARGKVYIEFANIDMRALGKLEKNKKIVERFSLGNPMFFV